MNDSEILSNTQSVEQNKKLTRRNFLNIFATSAGASLLVACGQSVPTQETQPQPITQPTTKPTETPIEEPRFQLESQKRNPDHTRFIIEHNLTANQISRSEGESDADYLQRQSLEGFNYLLRFRDAMWESPLRQTLVCKPADFGVVSAHNYPIALIDEWDIVDVINIFKGEVESGKTSLVGDTNYSGLLGTSSDFLEENGIYKRSSRIVLGSMLLGDGLFTQDGRPDYSHCTDTEIAVLLVHEFCHVLQSEMFLQTINANSIKIRNTEDLVTLIEDMNLSVQAVLSKRYGYTPRATSDDDSVNAPHFNELQANSMQMLFLKVLNRINQTDSRPGRPNFSGTAFIDPDESSVLSTQELDKNYINLYKQFEETVMKSKDALDPEWIKVASGLRLTQNWHNNTSKLS